MDSKELLKELCVAHAPSGKEYMLYQIIKEAFKGFGDIYIDKMNNIVIHKKGEGQGSIMISAHADEIFLIVTEICHNGILRFKGVGVDPKALISQEVVIHGKEKLTGIIQGEFNDTGNKVIQGGNLFIDTGYSKEFLEDKIKLGDFVTLKGEFTELLNNNVSCKTTDDRAGIVALYECAKELKDQNHDLDVYFVCSCQEELGHRGAKMISHSMMPDVGIAIDTTFDSGAMGDKNRENILGNGPIICVGPNLHPKLNQRLMNVGRAYKIPYGVEVEPGNTGTDTWDIQITGSGIPALLISIPTKYLHTRVEVINLEDIKNTGRLVATFIKSIKSHELEEILCF